MTPRNLALAAAAGVTSGTVMLSLLGGGGLGLLLAYLMPLPLMLIGLAFGPQACLFASTIGLLLVGLAGLSLLPAFAAFGCLPALLLTAAALQRRGDHYRGVGDLLVILAVAAGVVMLLLTALLPTGGLGIEAWLQQQAAPMLQTALPSAPEEIRQSLLAVWAALMPGMVGVAWLVMAMVNGAVGQWAVSRAGRAQRPTPAYATLRLPMALALAAGAGAAVGVMDGDIGYLARNLAIVLLTPFTVAGVVDVHGRLRVKPTAALWLGTFYLALLTLSGWAAVAVTAWGLGTQWIRSRRPGAAPNQEDR